MLFDVSLGGLGAMMHGMMSVAMSGVGVMGRLLVMAIFMMLGRFMMVLGGVLVMLGRLGVMLRCFLRHCRFSSE
jgi:hypothetical protein